jgi:6-pyruvoyl tetrahydropterin synthase/QueD family protein
MFQVSVEETFSSGHALRGYKGKCENIHGHNYRVQITLEGPQLDSIGLLVDFTHLKQVIREIIKRLDHHHQSVRGKSGQVFLRRSDQQGKRVAARGARDRRGDLGDGHGLCALSPRGAEGLRSSKQMNRSFLIILIPALIVAAGYIVVLRMMGVAHGYPRLAVAMILFFGGIYWLSKRSAKKAKTSSQ